MWTITMKPLFEMVKVHMLTAICTTTPQWAQMFVRFALRAAVSEIVNFSIGDGTDGGATTVKPMS